VDAGPARGSLFRAGFVQGYHIHYKGRTQPFCPEKCPFIGTITGQDFGRSKLPLPSLYHSCSLDRGHERFDDPLEQGRKEGSAKGREASVREGAGKNSIGTEPSTDD
jgi:hypothetical protein